MTGVDFAILYWIQEHLRCGLLDGIMYVVTRLGSGGIIWIAVMVVFLCTKKYRHYGIMLAISLAASLVIGNLCLKNIVVRPRPCWIDTSVDTVIPVPHDYSFPSCHTLSSAAAATVITGADRRYGICAIIMACLIAFSRLYLFVHFPTDVLAGAILGAGTGLLTIYLYRKKVLKQ